MKSYEEIFDSRGSRYDRAMRQFPDARRQEFEQLVMRAELRPEMVIADVPAGGGYLKPYLPQSCTWLGHEPCSSFTHHGKSTTGAGPLLPLPWPDASIDVAVSLAGVHHIKDKRPLFSELHRVVKKNGRFVLSDVATGSSVAHFLDDYVGRYNSTGHEGIFLDDHTLAELDESGWDVKSAEQVHFHWKFSGYKEMGIFCNGLFDVCKASAVDTTKAIMEQSTTTRRAGGMMKAPGGG